MAFLAPCPSKCWLSAVSCKTELTNEPSWNPDIISNFKLFWTDYFWVKGFAFTSWQSGNRGASTGEEGGLVVSQYGQKEDKRKKCCPLNTNRNTCGDCKVTACERLRQYTAQLHAVNYSCCFLCTVWRANFSLYVPCCLVSWRHDSSWAFHTFSEVRRNEIRNTRINIREFCL